MTNESHGAVGLRPYTQGFFLSGSYWFGLVALGLHAATYKVFGLAAVKKEVRWNVEWWRQTSHVSGLGRLLRNGDGPTCEMPAWFFYTAVALAGVGAVLAVVAFVLRWKRPIPAALALLLNAVPALVSLGLIFRERL